MDRELEWVVSAGLIPKGMKSSLLSILSSIAVLIAVSSAVASVTEEIYLSGTSATDTVPWEFYCTGGRNSGSWTNIAVPSCWELQGFGTYNYGHDRNPAFEQGRYRHWFNIPARWSGQNVQLVFEGSMTDTEVKVNGVLAGPVHQGSFYPFRFNVGSC
jgi:beta-galactosidase/beta-glucuronidase